MRTPGSYCAGSREAARRPDTSYTKSVGSGAEGAGALALQFHVAREQAIARSILLMSGEVEFP